MVYALRLDDYVKYCEDRAKGKDAEGGRMTERVVTPDTRRRGAPREQLKRMRERAAAVNRKTPEEKLATKRAYERTRRAVSEAELPRQIAWRSGVPFLLTSKEVAAILIRSPRRITDLIKHTLEPMGAARKLGRRWVVSSWGLLRLLGHDEKDCRTCGRPWKDEDCLRELQEAAAESARIQEEITAKDRRRSKTPIKRRADTAVS